MVITIQDTEYIKSGYFGMNSYTLYRIQTCVSPVRCDNPPQ